MLKSMDKDFKKMMILAFFIASVVIANVITGKLVQIGPFVVPGAFLVYAITFLTTDLLSELYGKKTANQAVFLGFVVSLFVAVIILLTKFLPNPDFIQPVADAYNVLLGTNLRFVIASMTAYYISQTWDVWVFCKLKEKTNGKHKWLRNNASTMSSQLIDTAIFITIAFWGVVPNLWMMILGQYLLKLIIAALDTPVFYLLTRNK